MSPSRRWPRALLLLGALYAALLLWNARGLGLLSPDGASSAVDSLGQAAADANAEPMDLTAILKAAGHPEPDTERVVAKESARGKLETRRQQQEQPRETRSASSRREEVQASVDVAMAASQQQEALREAREQVEMQMKIQQLHQPESQSESVGLTEEQQQAVEEAEQHARSVMMLPANETRQRQLKCVGWRATGGCSPHGPREPQNDKICARLIPNGESGYCEVEDKDTGERFRVMRRYCNSLKYDSNFRCSEAYDFPNFHLQAVEAAEKALAPGFALPNVAEIPVAQRGQHDGIVMVVYPKLIASAYATIRALRDVLGCHLPIEIWFRPSEMRVVPDALAPLEKLAADDRAAEISFHEIEDWKAIGYGTKVFAIYHSFFERVLFLDADNVPVRDPSFLFESREFEETGAVFWPDFWHPTRTIFNIHSQSLVWELLDLPFVNMFEQESGQLLIDRRRHAEALELVSFFAFHRPNHFDKMRLAHGDKDLFRFAWLKLKAPFHMIQAAPAVAGKMINESFCGLTMVQHDAQGEVLFLHRNSHKLTGEPLRAPVDVRDRAIRRSRQKSELRKQAKDEGRPVPDWKELDEMLRAQETQPPTLEPAEPDGYPDSAVWTHLLSFNNASSRAHYVIETYNADPEFPKQQNCYGQRNVSKNEHFYAQEVAGLSFEGLETDLRQFAMEARQVGLE
ncbi:hypothetical protein BBJ28_00023950 [Nothophytophthora sp. Chile5]|nr:hypothetical protein BBJ28_00023950 [Nothophytophthora sp. Chile5]